MLPCRWVPGYTGADRTSGGLEFLDAKAPEDAAGFKAWLQQVAHKAAEAGNEGGFLGFGGVAVSDAEKAARDQA